MNWFKGSVLEAITAAKVCDGIFIVYVYDKSDLSKDTREKLNSKEVQEVLSSSKYIAIEIENGLPDAIHFAQIYPLIVVPSLFFISPSNGIPLEVIGGNFEIQTLKEKLLKISNTSKTSHTQPDTDMDKEDLPPTEGALQQNSLHSPPTSDGVSRNADVCPTQSTEAASQVGSEASRVMPPEEGEPSLEEKVERAKELLAQKQKQKEEEMLEEEKNKELERRQQLDQMNRAKQKREDQEMKEITKQRKKEKEEDKLARERVRAQIAADKAERLARESSLKGEQPPCSSKDTGLPAAAVPTPPSEPKNKSNVVRIKFRFPDNSSEFAQFSPESTLSDIRKHLVEKSNLPFSRFKLVATLPPRSFTEENMPQSLVELGLTPSAIIIVKPLSGSSPSSLVPSGDGIMTVFWSLIAPLTFLINYLKGILGLGTQQRPSNTDGSDDDEVPTSKRPKTEGSYTTRNRPKTAYGQRRDRDAFTRREGNIHRINQAGDEEDDDDNNTWNGNSTQQM